VLGWLLLIVAAFGFLVFAGLSIYLDRTTIVIIIVTCVLCVALSVPLHCRWIVPTADVRRVSASTLLFLNSMIATGTMFFFCGIYAGYYYIEFRSAACRSARAHYDELFAKFDNIPHDEDHTALGRADIAVIEKCPGGELSELRDLLNQ
jgi:hypothetical protein